MTFKDPFQSKYFYELKELKKSRHVKGVFKKLNETVQLLHRIIEPKNLGLEGTLAIV